MHSMLANPTRRHLLRVTHKHPRMADWLEHLVIVYGAESVTLTKLEDYYYAGCTILKAAAPTVRSVDVLARYIPSLLKLCADHAHPESLV